MNHGIAEDTRRDDVVILCTWRHYIVAAFSGTLSKRERQGNESMTDYCSTSAGIK